MNNKTDDNESEDTPVPPGTPERPPVQEPPAEKDPPKGDPQPPEKKTPRLNGDCVNDGISFVED